MNEKYENINSLNKMEQEIESDKRNIGSYEGENLDKDMENGDEGCLMEHAFQERDIMNYECIFPPLPETVESSFKLYRPKKISSPHLFNDEQPKTDHSLTNGDTKIDTNQDDISVIYPYHCPECNRPFTRWANMLAHQRTAHHNTTTTQEESALSSPGSKTHHCDICGKDFSRLYNLTVHRRIHTAERPHECEVCGKGFSALSNLTTHRRTHTGEKPYNCSVCGQAFAYVSSVRLHMRMHTGERPFKCEVCSRTFVRSSHLSRHRRRHILISGGDVSPNSTVPTEVIELG